MSREYTLMMQQRGAAEAVAAGYTLARVALDKALSDDLILREIGAGPAELLESRLSIERAKRALSVARSAVLQAAWADGTLSRAEHLGEAVQALLSERPTEATAEA